MADHNGSRFQVFLIRDKGVKEVKDERPKMSLILINIVDLHVYNFINLYTYIREICYNDWTELSKIH